jgi:hypothetical protein
VLIDVVRSLQEVGVSVRQLKAPRTRDAGADAILAVEVNGVRARFAAELRSRAPYPGELAGIDRRRSALAPHGVPLLVVPFVSQSAGDALTQAGWSWGDEHGNFDLRATGLVVRQRNAGFPVPPRRRTLPYGSGSYAIIRTLIGRHEDDAAIGATALAAHARVSQPRASQVLRQLHGLGLVDSAGRGRWQPRREDLLDRFLTEYPGPGGSEHYFYSLDPLAEVAVHLARTSAATHDYDLAVSADVGPDLIRPWRSPTTVIVYTNGSPDAAILRSVEATGKTDANVIVRTPTDESVFPPVQLAGEFKGASIPLADPVQMIWDLLDLGGTDRAEAAGKLRQWLLYR